MSAITTHVLDTARGRPASGVPVLLELRSAEGDWQAVGQGETDGDGRLRDLLPAGDVLGEATYRLTFDTAAYFSAHNIEGFYPQVIVIFSVRDAAAHYHVPLLLNPYGYSTYRGS
ncbi:MAG TPA: hydroxyisourate hydrolase [Pyrinomonadaceae bacterium]|jgi:5-hydroxyisourate hydrolase